MRISLVDRPLAMAASTYDAYYNFYFSILRSPADASPPDHPRDDYRIYIHDKQGETLDVICNANGVISSIAFRQQAVKTAVNAGFDALSEDGPLAVIADPTIDVYYVDSIRCVQFSSPVLNEAVLVSFSDSPAQQWHPISTAAFMGIDMNNAATSFLFSNVKFIADE